MSDGKPQAIVKVNMYKISSIKQSDKLKMCLKIMLCSNGVRLYFGGGEGG